MIELIKYEEDKPNSEALFRLIVVDECIDVYISYKSFRSVLENLNFSSQRIGYVVRLLNKKFPLEVNKFKQSFEDHFTDKKLIDFLSFHGFLINKVDDRLDIFIAIKMLESRGYEVKGFFESCLYKSPISDFNKN